MLEKLVRIGLLLDFYGPLLTEKQRRFVELYYNNNLTLGEIAEESAVSRQAVHDILQRTEKHLERYERELGLVERYLADQGRLKICLGAVEGLLATNRVSEPSDRGVLELVRGTLLELMAE